MSNENRIAKNFIYTVLYKVVRMILPLITIPYVSRVLGAEKIGIYDYTYSIVLYFEMLAFLGFENYGSRLVAEHRRNPGDLNKAFTSAYYFQLISTFVSIGAYMIYMMLFCQANFDIAWLQIIYIISELFNISWLYFGLEEFKLTSTVNIIVRVISLFIILLFVKSKEDLPIYTLACSGTLLFSSLLLWVRSFHKVRFVRVSFHDIWYYGKGALLLFFPVLIINIYRTMDKIMLGNLIGMAEVAIYSNADKIVEVPYMILASLGVVTLPRMTNFAADGEVEKTKFYIEKSMRLMLFMACGMAFGMMAIGKTFAPVFFGDEFTASGVLIMVIAPHVIFRGCANVVRNQYLMPQKRDKDYIVSIIIGVVINLIFNTLFIPLWKASGAAWATLLAESFVAIYQVMVCRKEIPIVKYLISNCFFVLAGVIMFFPVFLYGNHHATSTVTILVQVIIGVVIYLAVAGGYLYKKEKNIINIFLKRRKIRQNLW